MNARIADMLRSQRVRHISFHTPGHKHAGADITELPYSDCLYSPCGVLKEAQNDIAEILGGGASFILTDGSTSGVFSMLYALRLAGGRRVAVPIFSHPCVKHACDVMGLTPVPIAQTTKCGIPVQPTQEAIGEALLKADALLLTSPDYYGFLAPLAESENMCRAQKKPLLVDGAHGSHLHFTAFHAGKFADMWVDGVHKSLPAMTQGAVVSAKEAWAEYLKAGVRTFRTTSPSYPVMASVEYAVKYPRNQKLEAQANAFKLRHGCVENDDWTKILYPVGESGTSAKSFLERHGVWCEFYDGNYLMFYLSPCTRIKDLKKLSKLLNKLPRAAISEHAPSGAIPMYTE